jgi:hypothetical protein
MRWNRLLVAWLLGLAGCSGSKGSLVVVTVDSTTMPVSGIVTLRNVVSAGGRSLTFDVPVPTGMLPPKRIYGIDVPPGITGTLAISIAALD